MKLSDFNNICRVCKREFGSLAALHAHLSKSEQLTPEEYYPKFFPKKDLLTGEPIPFKNLTDYKVRLFKDKINEFSFINKFGYQNSLVANILIRQLKYEITRCPRFPTYCEWRSSKFIRFDMLNERGNLEPFLKDAIQLCKISKKILCPATILPDNNSKILVDTREQKPLFKDAPTSINVGDYTFEPAAYNGVHIDRKSKADFVQTFTSGLDRFQKECEKAKALDINLVVLVEEAFSECFKYKPSLLSKQRVTGENAFAGLRDISRKFDIQFVFVDGRANAKKYVRKILSNPDLVKSHDLQYLIETNKF